MTDPDRETDFILRETRLGHPSLVPELRLHLADAALALWQATESDMEEIDLPPPYWAFAWPGGQALARLCLDRPELARGRRVMDFGAGGGVTSIAAAMAGARVVAVDVDAYARAALALNAAANGVTLQILDRIAFDAPPPVDLLLFGDMCYERPLAEAVTQWGRASARAGLTVLLADPGRSYKPSDGLAEVARYSVPTTLDLEDREMRETVIWRMLG
jgi:predicted nicotinamide N-methyase